MTAERVVHVYVTTTPLRHTSLAMHCARTTLVILNSGLAPAHGIGMKHSLELLSRVLSLIEFIQLRNTLYMYSTKGPVWSDEEYSIFFPI